MPTADEEHWLLFPEISKPKIKIHFDNENSQLLYSNYSSHQCGSRLIPRFGVICGLSWLVLYSAPRGFSLGPLVLPPPQKPTFHLIRINSLKILVYSACVQLVLQL